MFEEWKFRRLFGFLPPAKHRIDLAARKIVAIRLATLEAAADAAKAAAGALESEIRDEESELISKRSAWLAADKAARAAEAALASACHIAVACGFQPVARYQFTWDRTQRAPRRA